MASQLSAPSPPSHTNHTNIRSNWECFKGSMTSSPGMTTQLKVQSTVPMESPGLISPRPTARGTGRGGRSAWGYRGRPHSDVKTLRREIVFARSNPVPLNGELSLTLAWLRQVYLVQGRIQHRYRRRKHGLRLPLLLTRPKPIHSPTNPSSLSQLSTTH
jgi:hypothetical protein